MPWFDLGGDRLGRCATEGCLGGSEYRLEADGVGSNYCGNCRAKIESIRKPDAMTTDGIPLSLMITCVKREIAMRERVYPKWMMSGRMKQNDADREIATMKAVLHTLMGMDADDTIAKLRADLRASLAALQELVNYDNGGSGDGGAILDAAEKILASHKDGKGE